MTAIAFAVNRGSCSAGVARESTHSAANTVFLDRVRRRLAHYGGDTCQVINRSGFVAAGFAADPAVGHDRFEAIISTNDTCFFFDGRLDNRCELDLEISGSKRLSDAQLAFSLYLKHGDSFLQRLIGPFSIAIIEFAKRSVLLARDVAGSRPLYYHLSPELLVVASEAVGVLAYPGISAVLDCSMLASYFSVIGPQSTESTFFREVRAVPPGAAMRLTPAAVQTNFFRQFTGGKLRFDSDTEAIEQFRSVMQQAVACRLPDRQPAAILMSGGLDSTTVAALASRIKQRSDLPLFASSWVFDEFAASDERKYMLPVVQRLNLNWLPVAADNLWPLGDFSNWPHDPNTPFEGPYRRLATATYDQVAARGCRVLLNGEFGDHLFTGWVYWLRDLLCEGRMLEAARGLFEALASSGVSTLKSPLAHVLLGNSHYRRRSSPQLPWLTSAAASLLPQAPVIPPLIRRPEQWQRLCDPLNALTPTLEIRHAARHGIENRRPFRDLRLIELALQMPAHLFYRRGSHKWLLRELNRDLLPEITRTRRWTSTLAPLFVRGLFEREADRFEDLLWSRDRHWPTMVCEHWMRDTISKLKAGAPDGVAWVVLWRVLTYEIWRRRESYEDPEL